LKGILVKILLIGNYLPDAQESMGRYADLLRAGLLEAGHEVILTVPRRVLNGRERPPAGIWKWIGYLDKYILSAASLRRAAKHVDLVHVCDHSNSVYIPAQSEVPYVVTCHDLLAVRGAIGEDTDCPASATGVYLQRAILRGLGRAQAVACVSTATLRDAQRLLNGYPGTLSVVPNALHYPYRALGRSELTPRLAEAASLGGLGAYVLHVGSNQRRKNRECALRALSSVAVSWSGKLVFAGQPLTSELRRLAAQLGIADRVVEIIKPSNQLLEALYNGAVALLFPSRFEGFGWPIIEAQACGCPVICSDRPPFPEVAGNAAIMCDADDHLGFGNAIVALAKDAERREDLRHRGQVNSLRYGREQMIAQFLSLYEQVAVTGTAAAAIV
jgi:glycosyltransferase involved in cell wall biosynthesis